MIELEFGTSSVVIPFDKMHSMMFYRSGKYVLGIKRANGHEDFVFETGKDKNGYAFMSRDEAKAVYGDYKKWAKDR